jgi:hypothetical protein
VTLKLLNCPTYQEKILAFLSDQPKLRLIADFCWYDHSEAISTFGLVIANLWTSTLSFFVTIRAFDFEAQFLR